MFIFLLINSTDQIWCYELYCRTKDFYMTMENGLSQWQIIPRFRLADWEVITLGRCFKEVSAAFNYTMLP